MPDRFDTGAPTTARYPRENVIYLRSFGDDMNALLRAIRRERAAAAADFAETWIYCWNVPMAAGENDAELHWKRGVPTTGLQLIATGHSLTDQYMAFDVDEFARVSVHTRDLHYLDVARILLHNTKVMLALPGRTFDLKGPGWQQEHWSVAPMRGFGIHRLWLPWVSTSHLNGIIGLEEFDPALFAKLCAGGER